MRDLVKIQDKNINTQREMNRSLTRQAVKEKALLQRATRQSLQLLQQKNKRLTVAESQKAQKEIRNFADGKRAEYDAVVEQMTAQEELYIQQDALRSFAATRKTGAGIAQSVLAFSTLPGLQRPIEEGGKGVISGLLGVTLLSPIGNAHLSKVSIRATSALDRILTPILKNQTLQQLTASDITRRTAER